jgi:hypothetical protein
MSDANYNGRQPNNTSYIKTFTEGTLPDLWTVVKYTLSRISITFLTTGTPVNNVYIPGDLYVGGKIINSEPSNKNTNNIVLKNITSEPNSEDINQETIESLLHIMDNMQKQIDVLNAFINDT